MTATINKEKAWARFHSAPYCAKRASGRATTRSRPLVGCAFAPTSSAPSRTMSFSRLPARGYTRNMVNAYAKLVGLNPADITRMYLDDAYAYQVGRTRGESDSPAHVSGRRSVSRGDGRHDGRGQGSQRSSRYSEDRSGDGRHSQRTQRGQRQGAQRMSRREQQPQREYRESLASRAARAESESRRSNHFGGAVTTQFTNFYSGSQNNAGRGCRQGCLM